MKRIFFRFLVGAVIPTVFAACGDTNAPQPVGHFKDDAGNQILSFEMTTTTAEEDVKANAWLLGYAPGRMTAAYYYPKGSTIPAEGLTRAKTVAAANHLLYDTPGQGQWRFVYVRRLNGVEEFHDCVTTPADDLCRRRRIARSF
jgi:hypothetical protein